MLKTSRIYDAIAMYLKFKNCSFHWSSHVDRESRLSGGNKLGKRVRVIKSTLGIRTYVTADSSICNAKIGPFCSIGSEVIVGGVHRHPTDLLSTHPDFYISGANDISLKSNKPIFDDSLKGVKIGADVWIGTRSIIFDGISVGTGAIIGAGSVVTKNVPPYAICAGVPGRIIRYRFAPETIEKLLNSHWWEKDFDIDFPPTVLQLIQ